MTGRLGVAALLLGLASPVVAADPQPSAAALVATLQPAVVNLSITRHTKTGGAANIAGQSAVTERKIQGSGFIIDPAGIIVTNKHAIEDATDVIVTLNDTTRLRAAILAVATHSDIALLEVRAGKKLPALHFGESSSLRPGDPVLVAGNPLGFGSTLTLDRVAPESEAGSFFQVDAPLNTGNSGGPVFNMVGDVVGISTAFLTPGNEGGSVGLGLAIPSDEARLVIARLREYGRDLLGSIGIRAQPVTEDIAAAVGLPLSMASIITQVNADGSAARAGLESGDIVLTVGSGEVGSPQNLNRMLAASQVGAIVEFGIWRDNKRFLIPVIIEELPGDEKAPAPVLEKGAAIIGDRLGLALGPLTRDVRAKLGMSPDEAGVLVEDVEVGSIASDRGIVPGSVIVKVDRQSVAAPVEAQRSIDNARAAGRGSILLLLHDVDGLRWLTLKM